MTAFQLLHLVAHVQQGDRILVHAAASGVGTAALQLARAAGAVVHATAGSADKVALVQSLGALSATNYKVSCLAFVASFVLYKIYSKMI